MDVQALSIERLAVAAADIANFLRSLHRLRPSHDLASLDLSRPIAPECLFCHASGARAEPGTLNRVASLAAIEPIGCERCDGDGATHVAHPRRDNMVNPARLTPRARDSVCEQHDMD